MVRLPVPVAVPVALLALFVVVVVIVTGMLRATQVVLVDILRDVSAQASVGVLVESVMNSAEDARVADVIGNLLQRRVVVLQWRLDAGVRCIEGGIRNIDRMAAGAVKVPEYLGRRVASAPVIRG